MLEFIAALFIVAKTWKPLICPLTDDWNLKNHTHTVLASVLCFGQEACGILTSQAGIQPAPSALEGEGLTTGLPGKSQ